MEQSEYSFQERSVCCGLQMKISNCYYLDRIREEQTKIRSNQKGSAMLNNVQKSRKSTLMINYFFRRRLKNKKRERLEFNNSTFHIFLLSVPFIFLIRPIFLFYSSLNLSHVLLYKIHIL